MTQSLSIHFRNLLDELRSTDEFVVTHDHLDFLEKRFFEITEQVAEADAKRSAQVTELRNAVSECARILADYDEQAGDEGTVYRLCLAALASSKEAAI